MSLKKLSVIIAASLLSQWGAPPASPAKVVFTGYADLRAIPYGITEIRASQGLAALLAGAQTKTRETAFNIDSVGLFAATHFNDQLGFDIDITYKNIGFKTNEIRFQYANLFYDAPGGIYLKAGKITLPIGYFNENLFYPFSRKSIDPPVFQSAILGLPISDIGMSAVKTFDSDPVQLSVSAFGVNGYGNADTGVQVFRPGLAASGALVLSNNLKAANSNDTLAGGGKVQLAFLPGKQMKIGASGYYGPWSRNSMDDFTMANGYVRFEDPRFEFLAEYLNTKTQNDAGVVGAFGVDDWKSDGFFIEAALRLLERDGKVLHGFAGFENTVVKGDGGGVGTEELMNYKGGFSLKMNDFITLKTEYSHLKYQLPVQKTGGGTPDGIAFDRDRLVFAAVVSY